MTTKPQLDDRELCFLLNYFLGLPVILGKQTIVAPEIPSMVVASWTKHVQKQAELWIERGMREAGMLPKKVLRGVQPSPPRELTRWLPAYGRKTA